MSLPMRGAWIEIYIVRAEILIPHGRSPCGERGLKYIRKHFVADGVKSLPMRGAWIEITGSFGQYGAARRSPCGERGLKFFPPSI